MPYCASLIYLITMVCLGRKLRVGLKDSLLFLVVFCLFVLSTHNEVFMMRFSYLHNYVPILISLAVAAYITFFLRDKPKSIWRPMLGLMAGLLLGASNELAPLAVVFIAVAYAIYMRLNKKRKIVDTLKQSSTRTSLFAGVIIGLVFMFSNGAILERGSSGYSEVYDYVSLFSVLETPIYSSVKILQHLIFNMQSFWLPVLAIVCFLLLEVHLQRRGGIKRKHYPYAAIHATSLGFIALYIVASSQLYVLEDLFPRFMSPVFLAIVVSFVTFLSHIIDLLRPRAWQLTMAILIPALIACAAIVDVAYGFAKANQSYAQDFAAIRNAGGSFCVDKYHVERQLYSPLFGFTSFSPFEEWTSQFGSAKIYGNSLIYDDSCSPDIP